MRNHNVQALQEGERLVFRYRVLPGAADRSYGVEVARSAGMPTELVLRARELLLMLEQGERAAAPGAAGLGSAAREAAAAQPGDAGTLPGGSAAQPGGATGPGGGEWELWRTRTRAVLETLAGTDIMHLTPLQAMERLQVLAEQARLLVGWLDGENLDAGGAAGRP